MTIFKNKLSLYNALFYLIIIPLIGVGVAFANYVLIALSIILALPLNYLIYIEYRKEDKQKIFLKNKLQALGVGMVFFLLILANSKYGFF
ncbi:MAG: hypothetical protein R6V72_23635 [Cyclobacterium sp.]|uniref:hypothetical protein n=1 Tax=Cyclobacterium sp. TaxID=1966343 RepID=UPI0039705C26